MKNQDDKRYVNWVPIDEEAWGWLSQQADAHGMRLNDFIGTLLEDIFETWEPPESDEPGRRTLWAMVRFERRRRMRERVNRAANIYEDDPTEESADDLAQMCEDAGMDYGEVLKNMRDDPFSSLTAFSRNGSVLGECIRWLPKFIQDRGGRVPVRLIQIVAGKRGFSESTVSRARRAINNDLGTPAILTKRDGPGWTWYVRQESDEVEQAEGAASA